VQHAIFTVPNYQEGYTTDDNARALLVSVLLEELGNQDAVRLGTRYLAFTAHAFNHEAKRFRNFMNYQRTWLEEKGSADSHGRSLWALGTVISRSTTTSLRNLAGQLFEEALLPILETNSPRAWAFALLGIHEYLERFAGDRRAGQVQEELAGRLVELYSNTWSAHWKWFEDKLTYCNAILPHALLLSAQSMSDDTMLQIGLESLTWLAELQHSELDGGHFVPIGSNGFYKQGEERARFDQQPVEAQAMLSACLAAHHITGETDWYREARRAFEWFLGRNDLRQPLYDPTTGGCRDGLHPDRPNENQGAESTLAFLHSLLELRLAENTVTTEEVITHDHSTYTALSAPHAQPYTDSRKVAVPNK
jgi:hypothetical protein